MSGNLVILDPEARRLRTRQVLQASRPTATPVAAAKPEIRIDELIDRANDALGKMGQGNPHRWLILQLGQAVVELAKRLDEAESTRRILAARGGA